MFYIICAFGGKGSFLISLMYYMLHVGTVLENFSMCANLYTIYNTILIYNIIYCVSACMCMCVPALDN